MYYAICVMYVVLGVNNLIFARENDTYNLHTRSTTGASASIPNEPKSELITYKYKIPTQNSNL